MRGASDTAPLVAWTQTGHVLPTMDSVSFHRNNLEDSTFGRDVRIPPQSLKPSVPLVTRLREVKAENLRSQTVTSKKPHRFSDIRNQLAQELMIIPA